MITRVKFRKSITEEVRQKVHEFMLDKTSYEANTGVAVSMVPMSLYLAKKECRAVFHIDCIEIVPIEEWVKEEITSWPTKNVAYYGHLLYDYLIRMGYPPEKVSAWMCS